MDLVLNAPLVRLKNLFRLRDDVKALLEEVSSMELNLSSLLAVSLSFFIHHLEAGAVEKSNILPDASSSKKNKLPIKISFGNASDDESKDIENMERLSKVRIHLQKLLDKKVDDSIVLHCTFKFMLSKRSEILDYFTLGEPKTKESERGEELCEICGDMNLGPTWFCDVLVCGKCVAFFTANYEKRASLTCLKARNCRDGQTLDISCSACRMNRCVAFSMVEKYELSLKGPPCSVCQSIGSTTLRRGVPICTDCEEYYKDIRDEVPDPEPSCTAEEPFDKNCKHCLLQQFKALGLLLPSSSECMEISGDLRRCVGCESPLEVDGYVPEDDLRWNGSLCKVCETFVFMSMTTSAQKHYSCPSGELGHFCDIVPDSGSVWSEKCNYCWFRILEMGGVMELWDINENPTSFIRH